MLNLKRNSTALVTRYLKVTALAAAILVPAIWSQLALAATGPRIYKHSEPGGTGCIDRFNAGHAGNCSPLAPNYGITAYRDFDCYYDAAGKYTKQVVTRDYFLLNGGCCNDLRSIGNSDYPTYTCPPNWNRIPNLPDQPSPGPVTP